jgi:dTDP-4-amino-4,6-dideoxygalactose transaminase
LDEIQAAILRVLLGHLEESNATRREQADRYASALADTPLTLPVEAAYARHAYHLYVVRTPDRDALRAHLDLKGVQTQIHYPVPVHLQPAYARLGYAKGAFPNAERACAEVVSLPLNPGLSETDQQLVIEALLAFF